MSILKLKFIHFGIAMKHLTKALGISTSLPKDAKIKNEDSLMETISRYVEIYENEVIRILSNENAAFKLPLKFILEYSEACFVYYNSHDDSTPATAQLRNSHDKQTILAPLLAGYIDFLITYPTLQSPSKSISEERQRSITSTKSEKSVAPTTDHPSSITGFVASMHDLGIEIGHHFIETQNSNKTVPEIIRCYLKKYISTSPFKFQLRTFNGLSNLIRDGRVLDIENIKEVKASVLENGLVGMWSKNTPAFKNEIATLYSHFYAARVILYLEKHFELSKTFSIYYYLFSTIVRNGPLRGEQFACQKIRAELVNNFLQWKKPHDFALSNLNGSIDSVDKYFELIKKHNKFEMPISIDCRFIDGQRHQRPNLNHDNNHDDFVAKISAAINDLFNTSDDRNTPTKTCDFNLKEIFELNDLSLDAYRDNDKAKPWFVMLRVITHVKIGSFDKALKLLEGNTALCFEHAPPALTYKAALILLACKIKLIEYRQNTLFKTLNLIYNTRPLFYFGYPIPLDSTDHAFYFDSFTNHHDVAIDISIYHYNQFSQKISSKNQGDNIHLKILPWNKAEEFIKRIITNIDIELSYSQKDSHIKAVVDKVISQKDRDLNLIPFFNKRATLYYCIKNIKRLWMAQYEIETSPYTKWLRGEPELRLSILAALDPELFKKETGLSLNNIDAYN